MVAYLSSPIWFLGMDLIFHLIVIIISLLIVFYSYKCYKLIKERTYLYFALAFLSISIAFFSKIFAGLIIYGRMLRQTIIGNPALLAAAYNKLYASRTIWTNYVGFLIYVFLMLSAFMIIFLIASKIKLKDKKIIATSFYFVIITTILSMKMFYALYATLAVLLGSIIVYYYKNYKQKKSRSSMFVFLAFVFIFISQFFFIF
ncbi:MAG: hypothetical protein KAU20_01785, partial [Nanoarchaeota archaeon]|nr:hypothetical protein [Nanoarchaeota archaeon]